MDKKVLVIGGGIAGLTAAQELAHLGIDVVLIEQGPFIGGHAAHLACKATDRCLKCNGCLVEERLKAVSEEAGFQIRLRTRPENIERKGEKFKITLRSGPHLIDPEKCTDCGLCFERCPEARHGAILAGSSHHQHPLYAIDPLRCTYFQGGGEGQCRSICPEGAINLDEKEETYDLEVDGVLVATGYRPFDPEENRRFNFGRFKNMVTGMDLDKMLRQEGDILRPSDGMHPGTMAFIQCVGSRDSHLNHDYCSRVCCGYALRMALRIVHDRPETRITLFYMDIQNFGKDFDRYYEEAEESLRLVRGLPGDFYASDNDRISVSFYDKESQKTLSDAFDMVVLSVGMMPSASNPFLGGIPGLSLDEDGFLCLSGGAKNRGIVIAGSAEGPMDISEAISHAKRATLEMAEGLGIVQK
jgi:heterodisulfide reductase subunit A